MAGPKPRAGGHRPVGELVGVQLPEDDCPSPTQPRDGCRVARGGRVSFGHIRAARGRYTGHVDHVLDRHGHAPERSTIRWCDALERVGLGECLLAHYRDVGVHRRVVQLDPSEVMLHSLAWGELRVSQPLCELAETHGLSVGTNMPAGTVPLGMRSSSSRKAGRRTPRKPCTAARSSSLGWTPCSAAAARR